MMNKLYNIMTAEELLDEVEGEVGNKIRNFFRELQVEIAELEASLEENEESIEEMKTAATASDNRIEDLEQMVDDLVAEATELKEINQVLCEAADNLEHKLNQMEQAQ